MTGPADWTLPVVCDDRSHEPKVAKITLILYMPDLGRYGLVGDRTEDGVLMVDEQPLNLMDAFGTATKPPSAPPPSDAPRRHRHGLTCPLCGLRVEMREETLGRVAEKLRHAGVPRVNLRTLAAIL